MRAYAAGAKTGLAAVVTTQAASAADDATISPVSARFWIGWHIGLPLISIGQYWSVINTFLSDVHGVARIAAAGAGIGSAKTRSAGFAALPDDFTGIVSILAGNLHKKSFTCAVIPDAGNSGRLEFPHAVAIVAAIKATVSVKAVAVGIGAGLWIKIIKNAVPNTISRNRGGRIRTGSEIAIGVIDDGHTARSVEAGVGITGRSATAGLRCGLQYNAASSAGRAFTGFGQNNLSTGVKL